MPAHSPSPEHAPLRGRTALVTGANHGIGAATAIALAEAGADVALTYLRQDLAAEADDIGVGDRFVRDRAADATAVVEAIEALGRRATAIEADLADPHAPATVFDTAEATVGGIDILVNNASGWRKDSFAPDGVDAVGRTGATMSASTVDAQLLVDARGSALLIAELATRIRARHAAWGRIVGLTSGGPNGFPGEVSYGAAKAALENYTMSAAIELADEGVTANMIHPPVTDTGWANDDVREFVRTSTSHTHVAEPADVAEVIVWLCTDAARMVSGNVIRMR
ncbi:MAG: SDR family oxidoreductase [Actinomycetota bacterium]|nr:SDR family oxidoreductase [Actinomycetota bacterium]